jgi:hypothetical protein
MHAEQRRGLEICWMQSAGGMAFVLSVLDSKANDETRKVAAAVVMVVVESMIRWAWNGLDWTL